MTEQNNETDENQKVKLKERPELDLALSPVGAMVGFGGGFLRSFLDPFAIIHEINHIRNKGINTLTDYSTHVFGALGYGTGIYNSISFLCHDPKDIVNYAPLVTNIVSAGVQIAFWAYNKGIEKGLEGKV